METRRRNQLLFEGNVDREDILPKYSEYAHSRNPFFFEFGLTELPKQPGLLLIRGPRQYGKSSWLEKNILETIEDFGKGTAFYLNGDDFTTSEHFHQQLLQLEEMFPKKAKVKRIFVDEVTSVKEWEKAFKRAFDKGFLRDVLVVTTGSNARDILHGSERLPGRKGRLARTDYVFLPISYHQFYKTCAKDIQSPAVDYYSLCGGAPIGLNEITFDDRIPEFLVTMVQDWVIGDLVSTGRQKTTLQNIFSCLYRFGTSPVGFSKLAREAGLANNTVAAGYIEQLQDLLILQCLFQWDWNRKILLPRKPCKFAFINLFSFICFHPTKIRFVCDLENFSDSERGMLLETLVAQELVRRLHMRGQDKEIKIGFWQSQEHEIDFVTSDHKFYEVKSGKVSPQEFAWFSKVFPGEKLTIVCDSQFETKNLRAISFHDFLMEGDCLPFIREWAEPILDSSKATI